MLFVSKFLISSNYNNSEKYTISSLFIDRRLDDLSEVISEKIKIYSYIHNKDITLVSRNLSNTVISKEEYEEYYKHKTKEEQIKFIEKIFNRSTI